MKLKFQQSHIININIKPIVTVAKVEGARYLHPESNNCKLISPGCSLFKHQMQLKEKRGLEKKERERDRKKEKKTKKERRNVKDKKCLPLKNVVKNSLKVKAR